MVAALSPRSEDLLREVKNYIIQEGKYCLTFALRGCLIRLALASFLTFFPFTLTSSLLFLFNPPSLCNLAFFISISATFSHLLIRHALYSISDIPSLPLLSLPVYFLPRSTLHISKPSVKHLFILSEMIMHTPKYKF